MCLYCSVLLILIKMISDYCQIVNDLPNLVTDILTRLVDMIKVIKVILIVVILIIVN